MDEESTYISRPRRLCDIGIVLTDNLDTRMKLVGHSVTSEYLLTETKLYIIWILRSYPCNRLWRPI
jgi:hypothetical protein